MKSTPLVYSLPRGATTFSKLGVQFLGLGHCTEQNTDDIPSFVHCSLLHNDNHTPHQKATQKDGVVCPNFGDPAVAPLSLPIPQISRKSTLHFLSYAIHQHKNRQTSSTQNTTSINQTSGRCKTHKNAINGHYTRTTWRNQYQNQINPFSLSVHTESVLV